MRSLLLVVALAGCGGAKAQGPAWPAPSTTADDGGESIAPKNTALAAIADKPSPVASTAADTAADEDVTPAEPPEAKASAKTSTPAAGAETSDAADDASTDDAVIVHDEIVIEIDDDDD